MIHTVNALLVLAGLTGCSAAAPSIDSTASGSGQAAASRRLVWSDEFDKPGLPDTTKWRYAVGGNGWGNNELQFYTARRPENARVENGNLILEARREKWQGNAYTSARLQTQQTQTWTYGRFEARARLPAGVGTWPAIWMLGSNISSVGWPRCGELDIMEHVGYDEGIIHGTTHSEAYNHVKHTEKTGTDTVRSATTSFHVYAIEWSVDRVDFYVDEHRYFSARKSEMGTSEAAWPFNQPFYLLLNLAVGGNWGGSRGVDETIWPRRMEIDYVRVYQ